MNSIPREDVRLGETFIITKPLPNGVEQKNLLSSGDRVRCLYYKRPPQPDKDVMEVAHAYPAEAVLFVVDGEIEFNINGESVTLKKGDAMLLPYNAMMGSKVVSTTPSELLVVSCPDELVEKLKST